MSQFYRLAMPIVALALAPSGCDSERAQRTDRTGEVVGRAITGFEATREIRLVGLRTERAMIAAQLPLLLFMAEQDTITDIARRSVARKIAVVEQELASVDMRLAALAETQVPEWQANEAAAAAAIVRAEAAREAAWQTLQTAQRTTRS
jgi:hypothetical protein